MMAERTVFEPVDLREQLGHIDRMRAELQKLNADMLKVLQDTTLARPQLLFHGALTMAAMIGTVAAIVNLFY
jgi:acyl dehydratase